MCCRTRPLSCMNSFVRFQSWVVVTAKFSLSRNYFSKIFYYIPVKVRFTGGSAFSDDLDNVSRFCANGSDGLGCLLFVWYFGGVFIGALLKFFWFLWVLGDVFWGKGVL